MLGNKTILYTPTVTWTWLTPQSVYILFDCHVSLSASVSARLFNRTSMRYKQLHWFLTYHATFHLCKSVKPKAALNVQNYN